MNGKDKMMKVLSLIGYDGDKEKYIDEFFDLCEREALVNCINALPVNAQTEFGQITSQEKPADVIKEQIRKYIPKELYLDAFNKSFTNRYKSFLQSVRNTLSEKQIKEILSLTNT